MQKKSKTQRGITIIALIITIIVMLILVGVSVTVALNGGLFRTAQTATNETQLESEKEQLLSIVLEAIGDDGNVVFAELDEEIAADETFEGTVGTYTSKKSGNIYAVGTNASIRLVGKTEGGSGEGETEAAGWQQNGKQIQYVAADGTVGTTLSVGTKVTYDETKNGAVTGLTANMEWRVLGVNEEGEIELISTIPTTEKVTLSGKNGYVNAVTLLDTGCSAYGQGTGASGVRALTAEDINKLAGYDPETDYSGYGTKYTYQYDSTVKGILSSNYTEDMTNSNWTDTGYTEFYSPDWTISSSNVEPYELESTYYYYTVANELTDTTPDNVSWATIITKGEGGSSNVTQWLASRAVRCNANNADFGVRYVYNGYVGDYTLYYCNRTERDNVFAVRPVVSLESTIQLSDADSDGVYDLD